jgi:hypothetical protein
MGKKKTIEILNQPHVFEVGHLVANQNNELKVILKVLAGEYQFMQLSDKSPFIKRGEITTQPFCVFDEYNYKYVPKFN